jgi:cytochrome oxidase assembly protein ShyY1
MIDATQQAFVMGFIAGALVCFFWLLLLSRWYLSRVEEEERKLAQADNRKLMTREAMAR